MSTWLPIAWRNLWRNARRSGLTMGAIAFAVLLITFAMAMNSGQYAAMITSATQLLTGHLQLQAPDYSENPSLRSTVGNLEESLAKLRAFDAVKAAYPSASVFALVASGERSAGAQILGVDTPSVTQFSTLPNFITEGRYLGAGEMYEAVIGAVLARNIGAKLGDELIILGTGKEGSVAAVAVIIVGLMESGIVDLDRSLVQIPFVVFQTEFELTDEANAIVVQLNDLDNADAVAQALRVDFPESSVRTWSDLLPELVQAIAVDKISGRLVLALLALMVTLSIVNTFVMSVFERSREFGMLMSIGVRPRTLQGAMQLEALLLCGAGALLGLLLSVVIIGALTRVGIPLPAETEGLLKGMGMPNRLFPIFSYVDFLMPTIIMLVATQLAAFFPTLRIRRLNPIEAMREV